MKSKEKTNTVRGVWSPKALVVFSLLFTAFPSLIMFALNYGRYGFPRKRNLWFFITGSLLAIMLALGLISPEWSWHRAFILTVAMAWILYFNQIGLYRQWIASGKQKATIWSGLLICCVCFGVLFVSDVAVAIFSDDDYVAYELILNEQYSDAEKVLIESRQQFPEDLDVRYNLAVVYANTERLDMAMQEAKSILKINPDDEDAKELILQLNTKQ